MAISERVCLSKKRNVPPAEMSNVESSVPDAVSSRLRRPNKRGCSRSDPVWSNRPGPLPTAAPMPLEKGGKTEEEDDEEGVEVDAGGGAT